MDREQIEKWAREASRHLERWERRFRDEHPDAQMLDIDSASAEWKMEFARLVWNAALAEAKEAVRPKSPRPCMCDRCTCGNQSDAEACAAWDATKQSEIAIDALAAKEPQP